MIVVAIHTNIKALGVGVIWQSTMRVSIQMQCSTMALIPNTHGVMTQHKLLLVDVGLQKVRIDGHFARKCIIAKIAMPIEKRLVMITLDKMHVSKVETTHYTINTKCIAKCKVTKMVNNIIRRDNIVPIGNELFIHVIGISKRPIAILDDVGMVKVRYVSEVKKTPPTFDPFVFIFGLYRFLFDIALLVDID